MNGKEAKMRKAWLPSRVSELGVKVDIRKAMVTRLEDRSNIKNWISDRTDDMNVVLRRRFICPTNDGNVGYLQYLMESNIVTKEEAVMIANEKGCLNDACEYVSYDRGNRGNQGNNEGCVKYLLEMGCDPNNLDEIGSRLLDNVSICGNYHHGRRLLEYRADVRLVKKSSIRHTLKEGWDLTDDILKNLHERGMDPYSFC